MPEDKNEKQKEATTSEKQFSGFLAEIVEVERRKKNRNIWRDIFDKLQDPRRKG